jgi:hypothetical protein
MARWENRGEQMSTTAMEHDQGPPPASLAHPDDVAASLGYLDGQDRFAPAFARTARRVITAAAPGRG